ncbi:MAG TPA: hypothetical protein VN030_03250 [Cellvibrio sp.]|nr:hypothetical protein [Cellvibrio sp.]
MISGTQDIAIARLRVLSDKRTAEACIRDLQQASWPIHLPAGLRNAWVLVRELHIKATPEKLQRELRQQSAQHLNQLLSQAVEGRSASNSAASVYFHSLAQLLAFLLRDIALGQAARKWYWQRWGYAFSGTREQGIVQILCEHIAEVPAVVEQLAIQEQLHLVWQAISSSAAQSLVVQITRHFSIDSNNLLYKSAARLVKPEADLQLQRSIERQLHLRQKIISQWLPALQHLPDSDHRWRLAALISGISYCPLWILRKPELVANVFVRTLQEQASLLLVKQLARDTLVSANVPMLFATRESPYSEKTLHPITSVDALGPATIAPVGIEVQAAHRKAVDSLQDSASENTTRFSSQALDAEASTAVERESLPLENNLGNSKAYSLGSADFITRAGGFFYLINALRPLVSAEFLASQSSVSHLQASGWQWLFDCAWLLANRTGQTLDTPLLRFIASMAGCEDENSLLESESGFLSVEAQNLFAQLEQRFDEKPFWLAGDFLACPAQVSVDASHIDIFYSLSSVRLDIRLVGLDVNPGWVPWLGRVVTFHYVESAIETAVAQPGADHA